jgi:hypothetical protein
MVILHSRMDLRKHRWDYRFNLYLDMEVNSRKLLKVSPPITRMIFPIRTRALKVPLTSSWTGFVFLVDTLIFRAKMSTEPLHI